MNAGTLKGQLDDLLGEIRAVDEAQRQAEEVAAHLRAAIAVLEPPSHHDRAYRVGRLDPDLLVEAIDALGGEATTEQLVERLKLRDGRVLNGARRLAVTDGRITHSNRVYRTVKA